MKTSVPGPAGAPQPFGNLLLVEDHVSDQTLFCIAVTKSSLRVRVHSVSNGEEALDYLTGAGHFGDRRRYPAPDLVVLDLVMPMMNGLELLQRLRAMPGLQELPVVVLTGHGWPEWKEKALELGAAHVFDKGLGVEALTGVVRKLLHCRGAVGAATPA